MSVICPTVLASTPAEYSEQIKQISPFSKRIQIDLMDGQFAAAQSVPLKDVWWPHHLLADIHIMYENPESHLDHLLKLQPHMVIIHAEASLHHMHFAALLHQEKIKAGLAILPDTSVAAVEDIITSFDHLLIFSGNLGHFGGTANMELLQKAAHAKEHHPDIEIGWDGGVNNDNAKELSAGGIDVLNVGGYLRASNNPRAAFNELVETIA